MLIPLCLTAAYFYSFLLQDAPQDSGFVQFMTDNILAIMAGVGAVIIIFIIYLIRRRRGRDDVFKL